MLHVSKARFFQVTRHDRPSVSAFYEVFLLVVAVLELGLVLILILQHREQFFLVLSES